MKRHAKWKTHHETAFEECCCLFVGISRIWRCTGVMSTLANNANSLGSLSFPENLKKKLIWKDWNFKTKPNWPTRNARFDEYFAGTRFTEFPLVFWAHIRLLKSGLNMSVRPLLISQDRFNLMNHYENHFPGNFERRMNFTDNKFKLSRHILLIISFYCHCLNVFSATFYFLF